MLVVDDDPSWRNILGLELQELGYEPVMAPSSCSTSGGPGSMGSR